MKNNVIEFALILFFSLFVLFNPKASLAATNPYFITNEIPGTPIAKGATFFETDLEINYQSGNILLASNMEGTGWTIVDDAIELTVIRSDGSIVTGGYVYVKGVCSSLDGIAPKDFTSLFKEGINKVHIRLYDVCGISAYSSPLYLVNTDAPEPGPSPFLDLPWDYQSKGKTFENIVYDPESWFDHQYPLQNVACCQRNVLIYKGNEVKDAYRSHNGFDYSARHGAEFDTPILEPHQDQHHLNRQPTVAVPET